MRLYFKGKHSVLYWYSLALSIFALGFLGVSANKAIGSVLGWAGRSVQFAGEFYLLITVWTSVRKDNARTEERGVTIG
jgi:hypothetical protein